MKEVNKQTDEVIMSREAQALIKFRDLPIFYEDDGTTSDDCYSATLYKYDGVWTIEWLNDENQSIFECEADDICDVIEKAYNWAENNIYKNLINKQNMNNINKLLIDLPRFIRNKNSKGYHQFRLNIYATSDDYILRYDNDYLGSTMFIYDDNIKNTVPFSIRDKTFTKCVSTMLELLEKYKDDLECTYCNLKNKDNDEKL